MALEIPAILVSKKSVFTKHFDTLKHPLRKAVCQLLCVSDYAARQVMVLQNLLGLDDCQDRLSFEDYQSQLALISLELSAVVFGAEIRGFRHKHFLRLMLRELAGLADTTETLNCWSQCADALIHRALVFCELQLTKRYGIPHDESGQPTELFTLAMGKLGGCELNFSSDVDLIFAYTANGHTRDGEVISNQEFYGKVIQQFIQVFQGVTPQGFVFRVDLRLRPNGDSGPVVLNLAAMETYYQEQGRDWERYAMVKARLINPTPQQQDWFDRLIIPFVYRRYVDFSVIESLRSMKAMIEREVQLRPMLDDIKRGSGGIREVEFIIQSFQLIRGGRIPSIQERNAMMALSALREEGLMSHTSALQQAYLFLRKLENYLQSHNDQQTHSLPTQEVIRAQVTFAMGFVSWEELKSKIDQFQRIISLGFHAVLNKPDAYEDEKRLVANQLSSLWQGHVESNLAVNLLTSLGYEEAERCYQMVHAFRHGPRCRRLAQTARMRLDRFMIILLNELKNVKDTDKVLLKVLHLLENIVGRSAYLALLAENPAVLKELLYWFAHSQFITNLLVNQPFLLEVLIDQKQSWEPLSKQEIQQLLQEKLSHFADADDQRDELLRQFKLTCWLLAARAELYGQHSALRISYFLSDVAEVIITEVAEQACQQLKDRYPEIEKIKEQFAIIVYGKLGSQEMNYNSDVDLVFLHNVSPTEESLIIRLTQKILHLITLRTQSGALYSVDTRLRPSGSAGLLVSHVDAFVEYQRNQAWTWEHQALLRARPMLANQGIIDKVYQLKRDIFNRTRNRKTLTVEIQEMRLKISKHLPQDEIKHVAGGLLDLEFLLQFLVLAHPHPNFATITNTLAQLNELLAEQTLTNEQYSKLTQAYESFHQLLHQHILQPHPIESELERTNVVNIGQIFMRDS